MDIGGILNSLWALLGSPHNLLMLIIAVPIGMFFGAVPGLGGKLGIVLVIPFVFGMDPTAGAIFLLAMHSVVHTAGAIPSILFGVPGTGADAATAVDGFPMTKKGQAGRALGASLGASGLGGIVGGLFLLLATPIVRPLVLAIGPAEFFLLALFGITFIAMLSGESLIKGLLVGFMGLMFSFVALDPHTGTQRYTFDMLFLWDGVDIITVVLAIFAIPEMIALGVAGGSTSMIAKKGPSYGLGEVLQGVLDVFRHWGLALRTSLIGAFIGMVPGLGGDAASWICYGHAVQSSKTPERFGKGAVEGVIAPEAANHSKEGGSLIPTLFFAIPGSSGMAIMLGALVMLGIQPGPALALNGMGLVWTLFWAMIFANVLACVIFLFLAPSFGYLSYIRGALLIPFILVLTFLGSYLSHRAWENLALLLVLGVFGYFLKKYKWSRPPFVIGLILGPITEDSFHKSMSLWGPSFLLHPGPILLVALIAFSICYYIWRAVKQKRKEKEKIYAPQTDI
ncbi:tripartite tricarboxylate transporter permease [Pseudomonas agarici]|uniref:tripartite tricarboxylate transporter permease n=1 Tax=Pseudomonas agarici TaxID=46677 RepID=UPI0002E4FC0E|nr:tripartite tricarboxylate transporter permease [Pseudomonas agarici]NWB91417.1 tripartite tricarboxylate transporter permease [Pseudomonas agarici]NWC07835.1 tripartite tricarboxylate transporter permease [Pseudomonas agarici]SEK75697.1 TctA family transporter [Pseudomonas agarici]